MKKITIFLGLTIFLTTACNFFKEPNEKMGRQEIEKEINEESKEIIELIHFEKLNGIKKEFQGSEIYSLEYSAEIKVLKDVWRSQMGMWFSDKSVGNFYFIDINPKKRFPSESEDGFIHYKKGELVKFDGKMTFEKTENGWRKAI